MPTVEELDAAGLRRDLAQLADLLRDCVLHGASVGFLLPCPPEEAAAFWLGLAPALERGERRMFVVRDGEGICGTAQLVLCGLPNGRHRAEVSKVLVHTRARRRGIAQALMLHMEEVARSLGLSLLVLDTCTGYPAEAMYEKLGYEKTGVVPNYAAMPDGALGSTTFMHKLLR